MGNEFRWRRRLRCLIGAAEDAIRLRLLSLLLLRRRENWNVVSSTAITGFALMQKVKTMAAN